MLIKLSQDILSYTPIFRLTASKSGLSEVTYPTGAGTDGMPAAQSLLALFAEFQGVLNSYTSLIDYDGKRMQKIVDGFVKSDS